MNTLDNIIKNSRYGYIDIKSICNEYIINMFEGKTNEEIIIGINNRLNNYGLIERDAKNIIYSYAHATLTKDEVMDNLTIFLKHLLFLAKIHCNSCY